MRPAHMEKASFAETLGPTSQMPTQSEERTWPTPLEAVSDPTTGILENPPSREASNLCQVPSAPE